jgi:hypothetical protein
MYIYNIYPRRERVRKREREREKERERERKTASQRHARRREIFFGVIGTGLSAQPIISALVAPNYSLNFALLSLEYSLNSFLIELIRRN